jgi:hypothetical protein
MADHAYALGSLLGVVFFLIGLAVASPPRLQVALGAGVGMFAFGVLMGLVTRWRRG